jgi:hypothetical protein
MVQYHLTSLDATLVDIIFVAPEETLHDKRPKRFFWGMQAQAIK